MRRRAQCGAIGHPQHRREAPFRDCYHGLFVETRYAGILPPTQPRAEHLDAGLRGDHPRLEVGHGLEAERVVKEAVGATAVLAHEVVLGLEREARQLRAASLPVRYGHRRRRC